VTNAAHSRTSVVRGQCPPAWLVRSALQPQAMYGPRAVDHLSSTDDAGLHHSQLITTSSALQRRWCKLQSAATPCSYFWTSRKRSASEFRSPVTEAGRPGITLVASAVAFVAHHINWHGALALVGNGTPPPGDLRALRSSPRPRARGQSPRPRSSAK
jgi:hypothetical protein